MVVLREMVLRYINGNNYVKIGKKVFKIGEYFIYCEIKN